MRGRTRVVRCLALCWAALQFASPAVSAIADGKLAAANASGPATHVEATTTAACPVAHAPDCAVCRYLSGAASDQPASPVVPRLEAGSRKPSVESRFERNAAVTLPHGRAPPTV